MRVEGLEAEFAYGRQVVVAGYGLVIVPAEEIETGRRIRAVAHEVSQRPDLSEAASGLGILQDALESFEVAVDVGEYEDAQFRPP